MNDGVTFKRDNYPVWTALWCLGFAGAGLLFVIKRFVPSIPTPFTNWLTALTYLFVVISIIIFFFDNRKILSITHSGLYLFTGRPFSDDAFFLNWNEIKKIGIASRKSLTLFPRYYYYGARLNDDTLVIYLNDSLDPGKSDQFEKITSKLLSPEQLMSNKAKNEIWITVQPREGFGAVLNELSKYVETQKSDKFPGLTSINRLSKFIDQVLLPVGVLVLLYLSI